MRIRSFIIAYALVLAILLFADRRPGSTGQDRYSHVIDLTANPNPILTNDRSAAIPPTVESRTRIIAPDALIPGTWTAGQIPPERLIAPLVVIDLKEDLKKNLNHDSTPARDRNPQISLDDIAAWEVVHGMIPQGSVVAFRRASAPANTRTNLREPLPIEHDAAQFLTDARSTLGFVVETPVNLTSDRALARQLALRGNYVVEAAAPFTSLPATGSLIIVAPAKDKKAGEANVRILAMIR